MGYIRSSCSDASISQTFSSSQTELVAISGALIPGKSNGNSTYPLAAHLRFSIYLAVPPLCTNIPDTLLGGRATAKYW